jgi:hypothetical protein
MTRNRGRASRVNMRTAHLQGTIEVDPPPSGQHHKRQSSDTDEIPTNLCGYMPTMASLGGCLLGVALVASPVVRLHRRHRLVEAALCVVLNRAGFSQGAAGGRARWARLGQFDDVERCRLESERGPRPHERGRPQPSCGQAAARLYSRSSPPSLVITIT